MRLYSITNMYTSGIHAGIQTAHLVHEMFTEYSDVEVDSTRYIYPEENVILDTWANRYILNKWAKHHKTIIVLNGGYHSNLKRVYEEIEFIAQKLNLPYGRFHESKEALNGALTAVGVIVPEHIYNDDEELTPEAEQLRQLIKSFPLAK